MGAKTTSPYLYFATFLSLSLLITKQTQAISNNNDCIIIKGLTTSGSFKPYETIKFSVDAANSCDSGLYYRFAVHSDYGTDSFDGLRWKLMTTTKYSNKPTCLYTFRDDGKYVVVVWVVPRSYGVETSDVSIVGMSVNIKERVTRDPLLAEAELLLGRWRLSYTVLPFEYSHTYTLNNIPGTTNDQGGYYVYGTDILGNEVIADYDPEQERWTLLDSSGLIDISFVFYTDGNTILENSCSYQVEDGSFSECYTLSGSKISFSTLNSGKGPTQNSESEDERELEKNTIGFADPVLEETYWEMRGALEFLE